MNAFHKIICASLMIAGVDSAVPTFAAEVNPAFAVGVNDANAKVNGGDFDGALTRYAEVQQFAPESADLSYNMAVARYRKGEVAAAESLFQAAAASENDSLAAKARYNLGNCNYTSGLELAEKDRPAAIQELESAIENYRSSLAVEPNNADARANIELAAQLIEKLRDKEKQQQEQQQQNQENQQQDQQQNQDQQQQDNQQQNQENKDQQQNEQQQNQEQKNQDQQKSEQQPKDEQSQDEQSQDEQQQDQQQQQNQDQKQQQDSQSQSSEDEQQSESEKQDQAQQQNEQQSKEQQQDSAQQKEQQSEQQNRPQDSESQQQQSQQRRSQQPQNESSSPEEMKEDKEDETKQPPQGELTAASEEEAKDGKDKQPIAAFNPSKDGEMTQEEADKMLQAIRDREMLRRYQRRQQEMRQYVPVDRDW